MGNDDIEKFDPKPGEYRYTEQMAEEFLELWERLLAQKINAFVVAEDVDEHYAHLRYHTEKPFDPQPEEYRRDHT